MIKSLATLLLFFHLLSLSANGQVTITEITGKRLDTVIPALLAKAQLPGLSIAVAEKGAQIYSKGYGYADIEQNRPMAATTQIRTASVAKVLSATALGKLVTDGKLDFDAPIKQYVPDLKAPFASLTARQLAGHTSGVQHRPDQKNPGGKHYDSMEEMVGLVEATSLSFDSGTKYQYSTLGYNLLAAVIEGASGKDYAAYMNQDIFRPLGMNQTKPDVKADLGETDASMYFFKNGKLKLDKTYADGSYKLAGAGFRSTSIDLAKMMTAYASGFISAEVVADMFASNQLTSGEDTHVGIGWRLNEDISGRPTIEHAGSWQGARTVIVYYPREELSIAIMINAQCNLFIEETAHAIAQLLLDNSSTLPAAGQQEFSIELTDKRPNPTQAIAEGTLTLNEDASGRLSVTTESDWLTDNELIYLGSDDHYALVTEYGLLFCNLSTSPLLNGDIYMYQTIGNPNHMRQEAMLQLKSKP